MDRILLLSNNGDMMDVFKPRANLKESEQILDSELSNHYPIFKRVEKALNPLRWSPFRREQEISWRDLPRLSFGNLVLDTELLQLIVADPSADTSSSPSSVPLNKKECSMMQLFMLLARPGDAWSSVVSNEEIKDWLTITIGEAHRERSDSKVVGALLYDLRAKMKSLENCGVIIENTGHDRIQLVQEKKRK